MDNDRSKFEVIRSPKRAEISAQDFIPNEQQGNLFANPRPGLLIFVHFPGVTEEEFKRTVIHAKPSKVLELRTAARFDIGSLNRHLAFKLFSESGASYVDLTSPEGRTVDAESLALAVRSFLHNTPLSADRPVMILLSRNEGTKDVTSTIRQTIMTVVPQFTDCFEVPHFSAAVRSERARA